MSLLLVAAALVVAAFLVFRILTGGDTDGLVDASAANTAPARLMTTNR